MTIQKSTRRCLHLIPSIVMILTSFTLLGPISSSAETSDIKKAPKISQASLSLNEQGAQAVQGHRYQDAEKLFKKAVEKDSRNATAVVNLASMYLTNKKEKLAITLLSYYAKKAPTDAHLQARLGDAFFAAKKPKEAIDAYQKALTLDPSLPAPIARLASLYTMTNNLQKATIFFEKAVEANPKDLRSLNNLSSLYLGVGDAQKSIITAKKALRVAQNSETYITLGNAYQNLGQKKNALHSFKRAHQLGNSEPKLLAAIKDLEKVEKSS